VSGGAGVAGGAGLVPDAAPVVVLISADPRRSHRANEAMRIGLGVVAGENDVTFVLTGPGVHLLDADTDELVDGDDIAKFRTNLRALGVPFHVEAEAIPSDADWNADHHEIVPVTRARIAELVRQGRRLLAF
jgi:predicted peroxiredoxin